MEKDSVLNGNNGQTKKKKKKRGGLRCAKAWKQTVSMEIDDMHAQKKVETHCIKQWETLSREYSEGKIMLENRAGTTSIITSIMAK